MRGRSSAKPKGDDTRSHRVEALAAVILAAVAARKDVTLPISRAKVRADGAFCPLGLHLVRKPTPGRLFAYNAQGSSEALVREPAPEFGAVAREVIRKVDLYGTALVLEFNGPRGPGYLLTTELSPTGRAGTPDGVSTVGALLTGRNGAFTTGSDFFDGRRGHRRVSVCASAPG